MSAKRPDGERSPWSTPLVLQCARRCDPGSVAMTRLCRIHHHAFELFVFIGYISDIWYRCWNYVCIQRSHAISRKNGFSFFKTLKNMKRENLEGDKERRWKKYYILWKKTLRRYAVSPLSTCLCLCSSCLSIYNENEWLGSAHGEAMPRPVHSVNNTTDANHAYLNTTFIRRPCTLNFYSSHYHSSDLDHMSFANLMMFRPLM